MVMQKFEKVKEWAGEHSIEIYAGVLIVLVGLGSFGLGRLSAIWPKKEPITFSKWDNPTKEGDRASTSQKEALNAPSHAPSSQTASTLNAIKEGKYVASKSGRSYHFPWCPGAKQIKEENKIYFDTKEAAEKAGYRPAANCDGL